ncbi:hypothetical protein R3W88_003026 [Solanum pinnatisectum]|uniref:Uncharacterized protein n=1 Tax=Solanum pinnatisectum TaxID=50273 RepID=A0AAV9MMT4_9SOLN|nr:hypothetical protein R3W88_003026 [Solanum pinnatisectum]
MQTKVLSSVLTDTKESNSVEEKKSLDNAALFNKSPQRDASSTLAPFTKQGPVLSNKHIRLTKIKDHGCNWLFGGRRALTIIAQYFEVNNCSIDKSEHASIWHLCELLLQNLTKFPYVAANSASTSLDDIIMCIALLEKSHISIQFCHVYQKLSNNETTMSIVLQVANEVASLLLTNLTIRGDVDAYSNLEEKVLIGVGSIAMNGPRLVLTKWHNTELSGCVWDPG